MDQVDMVSALLQIQQSIKEKRFFQVVTLNAEILYKAQKDEKLLSLINQASLVTADGHGVVWAGDRLDQPKLERVTGIDLMQEVCRHAAVNNWRLFLLGGEPAVAKMAADNLKMQYEGIEICGEAHGFFLKKENGEAEVVRRIKEAAPDVLFVGMGAPMQEFWIEKNREHLGNLVAIGIGGSFDVLAGRVRRAPSVWQKLHLEWLWRVLMEPKRAGRILVLPLFQLKVIREASRLKRQLQEQQDPNDIERREALLRHQRRKQKK